MEYSGGTGGFCAEAYLLVFRSLLSAFNADRKLHRFLLTTRIALLIIGFIFSVTVHFRWSNTVPSRTANAWCE